MISDRPKPPPCRDIVAGIVAAGIIEAALDGCNFPAKVSAHWHNGTTFMVKFEEHVISRDKTMTD